MFALQSRYGTGNVGFESQLVGGLNQAKMFATNATGDSNSCVISVDSTKIALESDNGAVITTINCNGLVVPPLASEPDGQNGAIYYNTVTHKVRVCENGAWRDL